MKFINVFIITVCCAKFVYSICSIDWPIIQVNEGLIRGRCANKSAGHLYSFLGIPFADVPRGMLRFSPPRPAQPWMSVRNATVYSRACTQEDDWLQGQFDDDFYTSSEDCLYLNVYVPSTKNFTDRNALADYAVMVWIHGGQFQRGTASLYDPSSLVIKNNVIVVTINYRLSVMGFLSIQTGDLGNFGLRDQTMALTWIQKNIAAFGGDKNRITLFGHEAGAASILQHISSQSSKGLFHQAICQSIMRTSLEYPAKNTAILLANNLRCGNPDQQEMIKCLRSRSVPDIYRVVKTIRKQLSLSDTNLFGPSVGDNWMPYDPSLNITSGNYNTSVNIIIGTSATEGATSLYIPINRKTFEVNTEVLAKRLTVTNFKKVSRMIFSWYLRDAIDDDYRPAFASVTNDILTAWTQAQVRQFARHGSKVFNYRFSHNPSFAQKPYYLSSEHYEFIHFILGHSSLFTAAEKDLSTQIMRAWSSFAKTGTPEFDRALNKLNWPVYTIANQSYIDLHSPIFKNNPQSRLREAADIFWNDVVNTFRIEPTTPIPPTPQVETLITRTTKQQEIRRLFKWNVQDSDIAILCLFIISGASVLSFLTMTIVFCCYRRQAAKRNSMYNVETKTNELPNPEYENANGKSDKMEMEEITILPQINGSREKIIE